MKKDPKWLFFAICGVFFIMFFAGCQQATNTEKETAAAEESTAIRTTDGVRYVKNSVWNSCSLSYLTAKNTSRAASAEISASDLENIVDTLNEETNDDQLVVLTEDIPITESPLVDVYIAKAVEGYYVILIQVIGMERTYYVQNRQYFENDAATMGGVLFVDKVPETVPVVVVPVDARTRHEKYSVYMVSDKTNKIVVYNGFKYEIHCDEEWDALNGTGPSLGYPTIDYYFTMRVDSFYSDLRGVGLVPDDSPWRVVSGQIYVEPTE